MKKPYRFLSFCALPMMLLPALFTGAGKLHGQNFPANFSQVAVATGLSNPTVMAFAPDGRVFVAQQNGAVIVVKKGVKLATPAVQVQVNSNGERGLIGMALHPSFSTNGFIYLYYTLSTGTRNRVSRFTMSGDVISPSTEVVILDLDPLSSALNHNGGAMHFKGDKLYIAVGDNANGAHAQNLDSYHGKILRVTATGSVPSDNPFNVTGASEKRKRVWAYGLRNPFTFDVQPGTGRIFVNDVGQVTWEEIDNATTGGLNFGWPSTEGPTTNPAFTTPVFSYTHGSGDGKGCAITGGVFFNPSSTNYPSTYIGRYFYQDFCNGWINYLDLSSGIVRKPFAAGLPGRSLALDVGRDGNLYYLSRGTGTLYKIVYSPNVVPAITDQPDNVAVAEGQQATFTVSASGAAPLNYQWQKDNANIAGATSSTYTISAAQPSHAGSYRVIVSNTAGSVTSMSATLTVTTFNARPSASITSPAAGTLYKGGDVINFAGAATDAEDGQLPATAFSWSVVFHHDTHTHDAPPIAVGVRSGSFTIPNSGETAANVFYRLHLTVTDSHGLTDTESVDLKPRTTTITLNSDPTGLSVKLDGQPVTTPLSTQGVEGIQRTIGVVTPQAMNGQTYSFAGWAHGGAETQTIITPEANTTYTAKFSLSNALPSPWLTSNIGNVGLAGSAGFNNGTFTVSGSGNDIWNSADAFRYVYQSISGDADIRAKVIDLTNTSAWAKAGVMIRETLSNSSRHAMVIVTPSKGVAFQRRTTTGGLTEHTGSTGSAPHWVRLVRSGNTFAAYRSANGSTWTHIGSVNITMTANVFVGLPVTSNNNTTLCTSNFTNVSVITVPTTTEAGSFSAESASTEYATSLSVYPNPLKDDLLYIESIIPATSFIRIEILNLVGRVMLEKHYGTHEAGSIKFEVDMSAITEGIYVVRLHSTDAGDRSCLLLKQ